MNWYYAIIDTRPKTQEQAEALVDYYSTENHIPRPRIIIIKFKRRYRLVWRIYEKELCQKRGKFFVYGDVEEYRKHLKQSTATVEDWLKRKRK